MAERPPLLSLKTLVDKPTVDIDGTEYELSLREMLSLSDYVLVTVIGPRFSRLMTQEERTEEETSEARNILDRICRIVLNAPPDVRAKLNDVHRLLIYKTFLMLPLTGLPMATPAKKTTPANRQMKKKTGGRSSRGLHASTAENQPRGSEPSPLPS